MKNGRHKHGAQGQQASPPAFAGALLPDLDPGAKFIPTITIDLDTPIDYTHLRSGPNPITFETLPSPLLERVRPLIERLLAGRVNRFEGNVRDDRHVRVAGTALSVPLVEYFAGVEDPAETLELLSWWVQCQGRQEDARVYRAFWYCPDCCRKTPAVSEWCLTPDCLAQTRFELCTGRPILRAVPTRSSPA